ncbi:MAG: hypothetical protein QG597_3436, partial [Actinomycetota bacterium]|nr:hypothetical protein [Actinomycetota bacterium]
MVGVLISLLAAWNAQQRQEDAVQADFHADVVQIEDDINEAFTLYQYGLRGARGAVLVPGADNVTREQFATYSASRDVDLEFPGSRGFGFIRKVPMAQEEEFLAAARADDAPDFQIKEIAPNTGDARYVIQYIEPVADNRAAVGLDTASEVRRKAAADQASQTGQVTISDPITLVQAEAEAQQSFLIFLPVYQPGLPLDTPEQRQAATVGWSYTPIVTREVLEDIGVDQQAFAFELSQVKPDGSTEAFYTGPGFAEAAATDVSDTTLMEVFGSEWMLQVRAKPAFLASVNATSPRQVLAVGLIATLLASALTYAYMLARSRRREASAQKEELERGRELGYERQRFENILTGTNAGTWEWNVQTGELRLNDRWAEIVGYTLDELAPTTIETWIQLTHPADLARSEELLAQHFDGDLDFYDLEVRMRHKDGHWVWVHDRGKVASWTPDGRPEWMFGTHMDITRTRELQRALTEAQDVLERGGQHARLGGWRLKVGADPTDLSGTELLWTETTRAIHEVPDGYVPDVTEGIQFYAEEFQPVITAAVH